MTDKKKITQAQLKAILSHHKEWLGDKTKGKRADLSGTDLSGADMPGADLTHADLRGADLTSADLSDAKLLNANMYDTGLSDANLSHADLSKADLGQAYMHGTNLVGAQLSGASGLSTVRCDIYTAGFRMTPPATGEYVAWKKAGQHIIKLRIPATAKRSSATTRKCRASEAEVLGIYTLKGKLSKITTVSSYYDKKFSYKVGAKVSVPDFDPDRWAECAPGIHHFLSMEEAIEWVF